MADKKNITIPSMDAEKEHLHEAMGVTDERGMELTEKSHKLMDDNNNLQVVIPELIKFCDTDAEVAFSLFAFGATYGRLQAMGLIGEGRG